MTTTTSSDVVRRTNLDIARAVADVVGSTPGQALTACAMSPVEEEEGLNR